MAIPRDRQLDSTLALLHQGYNFIGRRCARLGSDIFRSRLMLHGVTCMRGAEAARLLYAPDLFTRKRAVPKPTLKLLQDEGSVQLLDGAAHRARKQMFMSLMTPEQIDRLVDLFAAEWRVQASHWETKDRIVLFPEVQAILCRAVCAWTGIRLRDEDAARRTREFAAMIDGAGAVGPRNWRGMMLRRRTERWAREIIRQIRAETLSPPRDSAAAVIAFHRDDHGRPLDNTVAAIELLNVLRPTIAVANYILFAALALHEHSVDREKLLAGDTEYLENFAQEVRRFYPFFPFIGGRATQDFEALSHRFRRGEWVLLDLYGTNHDPQLWDDPWTFRPDRFRGWDGDPNNFIPQGAGDMHNGHRCPGERITVELIKAAVYLLTKEMDYDVPPQDLGYSLSRIPALPRSRFVMTNVQRVEPVLAVAQHRPVARPPASAPQNVV